MSRPHAHDHPCHPEAELPHPQGGAPQHHPFIAGPTPHLVPIPRQPLICSPAPQCGPFKNECFLNFPLRTVHFHLRMCSGIFLFKNATIFCEPVGCYQLCFHFCLQNRGVIKRMGKLRPSGGTRLGLTAHSQWAHEPSLLWPGAPRTLAVQ